MEVPSRIRETAYLAQQRELASSTNALLGAFTSSRGPFTPKEAF
jgi:hypothetical protein